MTKKEEIYITDKRVIAEIESMQKYIKSKKETATETEIVQACIQLARRLGAGDWSIYLEVKRVHEKEVKK